MSATMNANAVRRIKRLEKVAGALLAAAAAVTVLTSCQPAPRSTTPSSVETR